MNERIVEIAHEVFTFKYKTAPHELNPGHHMDHIHLFAELIIKEASDAIAKRDPRTAPAPEIYLLQYFGVQK